MSGGQPAHLPAKGADTGQIAIRTNIFDGLDEAFAYIASCPEQQRYSMELELQGFIIAALEVNEEYMARIYEQVQQSGNWRKANVLLETFY